MRFYCLQTMVLLGIAASLFMASPTLAAETYGPWCEAKSLDARVLPPFESKTPGAHGMVIEFQNRGNEPCELTNPGLNFFSSSDSRPIPTFVYANQEQTEAETAFWQRHWRLAPGDLAHVLVTWSSRVRSSKAQLFFDCGTYDSLTLGHLGDDKLPAVSVRNLRMQACDEIWISRYRPGHFTPGERITPLWLKRIRFEAKDFVPRFPQDLHSESGVSLRALYDVQFIPSYDDHLFLNLQSQSVPGCPFDVLRKRESSGATVVYLNHCAAPWTSAPAPDEQMNKVKEMRLDMHRLGLLPDRPGRVEYEVISEVIGSDGPSLALAKTGTLTARDRKAPQLPSIDTDLPGCKAAQLQMANPPVRLGKHWTEAKKYATPGDAWNDAMGFEFTNTSAQACLLGGAPELRFLNPPGEPGSISPDLCRNCPASVYRPRESRWIELKSHDSAHFFVARTVFDEDYAWYCTVIARLELVLPDDKQPIPLPFDAGSCGQVRVSAWREGKYDGDPMNVKYRPEQLHETAAAGPLVENCSSQNLAKYGKPVEYQRQDGVFWGFSVESLHFTFGDPVLLHMWIANATDQTQSVEACPKVFPEPDAFDLYDDLGRRVLSKKEAQASNHPKPKIDGPGFTDSGLRGRSNDQAICNMGVVPAHTCYGGDDHDDHNVAYDLTLYYDLPPGHYFLVPEPWGQRRTRVREASTQELSKGLVITIEP